MTQRTIRKPRYATSPDPVTYYIDKLRETRKTWKSWRSRKEKESEEKRDEMDTRPCVLSSYIEGYNKK